jgi:hypothetical protein
MLAISAVAAAASYAGQKQQAKATEAAAQDAFMANQSAVDVQQLQSNERASQEVSASARQAMIQRGRLQAIAAETGAGGNSMDRIMGEVNFATATDMATIERNRSMREAQGQLQKRGMQASAQSAINTSNRPSELGLAASLAGTAVQGYGAMSKLKIPTTAAQDYTHGTRDYW